MKTVTTNVYTFSELSEEAKKQAIEEYRNNNNEIFWADENRESMEKFADIFPIKVTEWCYGGRGEGVSFRFISENCIEELSGQRLATYLWNNYKSDLYSKKYYYFKMTDTEVMHKRVKSTEIKRGPNKGKFHNAYYSAIKLETDNCPLTGYCIDNDLLCEIWLFIESPDSRNFRDLLEDCFAAWIKACNADIDYQNSNEYISENMEANQYEFTEDGKQI